MFSFSDVESDIQTRIPDRPARKTPCDDFTDACYPLAGIQV